MHIHVNRIGTNEAYGMPLTGTETLELVLRIVDGAADLSFDDIEDGHVGYFRDEDGRWLDVNRLTWGRDELAGAILSNARAFAALGR